MYFRSKPEWTKDHDINLCRDILVLEPFKYTKRSTKRGEIWREISHNLNSLSSPKFKTTDRSVRDRFSLIQAKYKEKMRYEEGASGIDCEETELDQALAEITEKEEEADRERNEKNDTQTKKNEKDKAAGEDVRLKAMETMRRKSDDFEDDKPSKRRRSTSDAVEYLKEKFENEKDLRKEELEIKKNEQQMMMAQMKIMQEQSNALLALLAKKL